MKNHLGELWFKKKGWIPFDYQKKVWSQIANGDSGIISVPTGAGKTYAAFLGFLQQLDIKVHYCLRILYISPLKALARDIEKALWKPIEDLELHFRVESRTGDTPFSRRKKQRIFQPDILITTPESLALLIGDPLHREYFKNLQGVILDEWHELLGTKRGLMLELCLSHLKSFVSFQTWALSATFANLQEAARSACGKDMPVEIIQVASERETHIRLILPKSFQELPLSGIFGMKAVPNVIEQLDSNVSTLIFTNTRGQAEKWYQVLIETKPEWKSIIRLHHSAGDKKERTEIEEGIKSGRFRFVICTSSLDLGVDFPPIEKVIQIGSPKSISRLLQRAGRASHRPLASSTIFLVPTHALDLIEFLALKLALLEGHVEDKAQLEKCYDVLLQHLVTVAIGGGFEKEKMYIEIKRSYSYSNLTKQEYEWCLHFLTYGGKALSAYSEYRKMGVQDSYYAITDRELITRHRMNIGTIVTSPMVQVELASGKKLGFLDEEFLSKLEPGESFNFGGRSLELVQLREMTAYVRLSKKKTQKVPSWGGKFFPISPSLSFYLRKALEHLNSNQEQGFLQELAHLQNKYSIIPQSNQLLVETCKTREGFHLFFYPLEGRIVHEGLATVCAYRLSLLQQATFQTAVNDYGFEVLSSSEVQLDANLIRILLNSQGLEEDILKEIHFNEMAKRKFREIAKIAGLVFSGYPGKPKTGRQLQISTSVLYEVLNKYEPNHLLIKQAKHEVLNDNLEMNRLKETMDRLASCEIILLPTKRLTPFALPLFIEWMHQRVSSEKLLDRVERLTKYLQK